MSHEEGTKLRERLRSSASAVNIQYLPVSLMSTSSCLHLLPRLPVPIFPSITMTYFNSGSEVQMYDYERNRGF
jgi:hypothetical protein